MADDDEIGARFCAPGADRTPEPRFSQALVQRLLEHSWSHHVRELDAVLWASIGSSTGTRLDMTESVRAELDRQKPAAAVVKLDDISAERIRECLDRHQGVRERVWRELGLKNRWVLNRLIKKHGLDSAG